MRRLAALAAAAVLIAACSNDASTSPSTSPTTDAATTTAAASTTTVPESTTTTVAPVTYAATIDELLAMPRPIVLAHTGGEDNFPASTLFSYGESVKAGVDMLDLNVQLTKDGVLLVQHDDAVDRNTDSTGKVADLTFDEISKLDGAYWFATDCADCHDKADADYLYRGMRTGDKEPPAGYTPDDFALPSFRQLVEKFPTIPLNIEIKGEGDVAKRAADVLKKELDELGRNEASVVASFQDDIVSYFHQIAPDVEVSPGLNVLTSYVLDHTPVPDGMRILQLPPEYSGLTVITPQLMVDAAKAGYPIWIWPNKRELENLASYRDFLAEGIAGLNINFPAQGVQAVQEYVAATSVQTSASKGCGSAPAAPGTYPGTLSAAGLEGTFDTYLPTAYDGSAPLPLVMALHGYTQTPGLLATQTDLPARGDRYRFITVTPDITRPVARWDTALDSADVQWISALLDEVENTNCIDTNRVYVTGMSNGAMMTSTLACVLADRFAAAAPVAGVRDPKGCAPARPISLLAFHGTEDPYVAYTGGLGPKALALPAPDGNGTIGDLMDSNPTLQDPADAVGVPERMAAWAQRNGCTDSVTGDDIGDVTPQQWTCPDGVATQLYTVNGGGHSWPGSAFDVAIPDMLGATTTAIDATTLMWQFFQSHPLAG